MDEIAKNFIFCAKKRVMQSVHHSILWKTQAWKTRRNNPGTQKYRQGFPHDGIFSEIFCYLGLFPQAGKRLTQHSVRDYRIYWHHPRRRGNNPFFQKFCPDLLRLHPRTQGNNIYSPTCIRSYKGITPVRREIFVNIWSIFSRIRDSSPKAGK